MTPLELLQIVINTLNTIPVTGKDNMEKMVGAVRALENLKDALTKEAKTDA